MRFSPIVKHISVPYVNFATLFFPEIQQPSDQERLIFKKLQGPAIAGRHVLGPTPVATIKYCSNTCRSCLGLASDGARAPPMPPYAVDAKTTLVVLRRWQCDVMADVKVNTARPSQTYGGRPKSNMQERQLTAPSIIVFVRFRTWLYEYFHTVTVFNLDIFGAALKLAVMCNIVTMSSE